MLSQLSHQSDFVMLDYLLHSVSVGEMGYQPVQEESTSSAEQHFNNAILEGAPTPPFVIYNGTLIHSPFGHPGWLYSMDVRGPAQPTKGLSYDLASSRFHFGASLGAAVSVPDLYDFAFNIAQLLEDCFDDSTALRSVEGVKDTLVKTRVPAISFSSYAPLSEDVSLALKQKFPWLFN